MNLFTVTILMAIAVVLLMIGVSIASADTICREVNGKLFCYDTETETNTTCRVINGTVYCS